ncbi:MAG: hypothetical protein K0S09_771 [Sphingobacteriaceae bacterium]|jgi:putative Mn2+ efflux pump MntP|nr:hypothetical protein [Sphingobacteriaceae bacterium]
MKTDVIISGTIFISVLHGVIPNHWLPVLAVSRKEGWSLYETIQITFIAGLAHAISTILIGIIVGTVGIRLSENIDHFTHIIGPALLVAMGIYFLWRHHTHNHFKLRQDEIKRSSKPKLISLLMVAMFLSPCLEIEAYFLMAGTVGWHMIALMSFLYLFISIAGMVVWVTIAYKGLLKLNWHSLEHNAGIITGLTLIATGCLTFFKH